MSVHSLRVPCYCTFKYNNKKSVFLFLLSLSLLVREKWVGVVSLAWAAGGERGGLALAEGTRSRRGTTKEAQTALFNTSSDQQCRCVCIVSEFPYPSSACCSVCPFKYCLIYSLHLYSFSLLLSYVFYHSPHPPLFFVFCL